MHPLKLYLIANELTAAQFAQKVKAAGVTTTAGYINQIVIGHRYPSRILAHAISQATEGAVSVGELMEWPGSGQAA